jgi:RecJ-like exonuclease
MHSKIQTAIQRIDEISKTKPILVISHFDTDGITSAAIFSRALARWGKKFNLRIVKGLDEQTVAELPESHLLIFLDLASGSLDYLATRKLKLLFLIIMACPGCS